MPDINFREDQGHRESPCQKGNTQIRNQRKDPRALIELREDPLLSITRKKFGQ
jgi:hypothetical protein